MFRAAFHTGYVDQSGILRLNKSQLDSAFCDDKIEDDFFIDLIFAPIENATTAVEMPQNNEINSNINSNVNNINSKEIESVTGLPKLNSPNDSGIIIDYQNIDKYDMSLHRDGRFWDAIKERNNKKGKRNNRQYLTKSPQQFCIVDKNDKNLNLNISKNEIINNNTDNDVNSNNNNDILVQQLLDASNESNNNNNNNRIKYDIEINETENIENSSDIFNNDYDVEDDYNDDDDEMINSMMNMLEKNYTINDSIEDKNIIESNNIDNLEIDNDIKLNFIDGVGNDINNIKEEEEYDDVLDELERFMGTC
jgi:hypothetical protein